MTRSRPRLESKVEALWRARPGGKRHKRDTEPFVDEMWSDDTAGAHAT